MYELKWSHAEKKLARRAFDLALGKELEAIILEAKERAAKIVEPSELWDLEGWLTLRRREIERSYDYRYSILPIVFAHLLRATAA
jgi:Photoprotection regulator fluorescence recovery protein